MNDERFCEKCQEPVIDKTPACPLQCNSPKCKAYQQKSKINFNKKPIVWILGGPGSGKGTQCEKIIAKYGFTHLSIGDLLREEVKKGGERSKCLATAMEHGELVATETVLSLLLEAMEARAENAKGFLIDGYPREKHQGIQFEKVIGRANLIIYFEASHDTLTQRLLARAEKSNRFDDSPETIPLRLKTFYENNDMVLEQYPNEIRRIDAEGSPDKIFNDVVKALEPLIQSSNKQ